MGSEGNWEPLLHHFPAQYLWLVLGEQKPREWVFLFHLYNLHNAMLLSTKKISFLLPYFNQVQT